MKAVRAIALSIIAGVDPKAGVYASFSIVVLIAIVGGRPGMISAATAAKAVLMITLVRDHALKQLLAATVLAGLVQIGADLLKLGRVMRYVSKSVTTGYLNALAILIFMAQLPELNLAGSGVTSLTYALMALGLAIIYLLPRLTTLFGKAVQGASKIRRIDGQKSHPGFHRVLASGCLFRQPEAKDPHLPWPGPHHSCVALSSRIDRRVCPIISNRTACDARSTWLPRKYRIQNVKTAQPLHRCLQVPARGALHRLFHDQAAEKMFKSLNKPAFQVAFITMLRHQQAALGKYRHWTAAYLAKCAKKGVTPPFVP